MRSCRSRSEYSRKHFTSHSPYSFIWFIRKTEASKFYSRGQSARERSWPVRAKLFSVETKWDHPARKVTSSYCSRSQMSETSPVFIYMRFFLSASFSPSLILVESRLSLTTNFLSIGDTTLIWISFNDCDENIVRNGMRFLGMPLLPTKSSTIWAYSF